MNRYQAKAQELCLWPFYERDKGKHSEECEKCFLIATALLDAENLAYEKASQIAMTTKYDRIEYSDEGCDMRVTHHGNKEIAEAIRALKGAS